MEIEIEMASKEKRNLKFLLKIGFEEQLRF